MEIRRALPEDIKTIADLEREIFCSPWSSRDLLDAAGSPNAVFLTAAEEKPRAYGIVFCAADEAELVVFAVDPQYRRQGLGTRLLQALLSAARERGAAAAYLEVRRSNAAAQGLYQTCGFAVCGVRKNFYRFPAEDALLMKKTIGEDGC